MTRSKSRCAWAAGGSPLEIAYHDREWGVPVHDDRALFEFLILEGAQAGLSWATILNRREGYRRAFSGFDPAKVARYGPARLDRLLENPEIIRNRLKVHSAVGNARAFLEIQQSHGCFAHYLWAFTDGKPLQNRPRSAADVPASTPLSEALSRDLKRRGFKFVGATICYAFMQATGMVNDHLSTCFRARELG